MAVQEIMLGVLILAMNERWGLCMAGQICLWLTEDDGRLSGCFEVDLAE